MFRSLLVYFLCLVSLSSVAQVNGPPVDSLLRILEKASLPDTTRALLLTQLTNALFTERPDTAMQCAEEALQLSIRSHWDKGIAYAWLSKGGVCYMRGDYVNALDCFLKVLDTKEMTHNKILEGKIYNNVANVYSELKQYGKSLEYFSKSLESARIAGDKETQAMVMGNMGTIYQEEKKYDSAQLYYEQSLAIAEQIDNKMMICSILCTTGSLLKETGKYQESITYSEKSVAMAKASGNDYVLAPALNNMAWAYLYLKQYEKTEQLSKASLEVAEKIGTIQWQSEAWETLYTLYEKQQQDGKALVAYKHYIALRDSAINNDKQQEITRKEVQYENDKKAAVRETQHQAEIHGQRIVRNAMMGGAGILLLAGCAVFFSYKRRRDAALKVMVAETDSKVLRLQMNPHFIFNSLNSIGDYMIKNNTTGAKEYLAKFAKVMRLTLENAALQEVPLSEDLKALALYMDLEALRTNHKFTYKIIVAENIDPDVTLIPPMIFQPYIENSIWHGIARKEGAGEIMLHIQKLDDMLQCRIEDDGIGRQPALDPERKSMGMQITQRRLDMMNRLKHTNATVTLSDLHPGTRVELLLPLELRF
jgi:tetratricopeptide (TPR) repeat protein